MNNQPTNKLFDYFPKELKKVVVEKFIEDSKKKRLDEKVSTEKVIKTSPTSKSPQTKSKGNTSSNIKTRTREVKEFAFDKHKKLPLDTKQQVLSALVAFWKVKNIDKYEKLEGFQKILKKCEFFNICTMGFNKECENRGLFSQNLKDSEELKAN